MTEPRSMRPRVATPGRKLTFAKPLEWMLDANCSTPSGTKWSITNASAYDQDKASPEQAAELCAGCPVIEQCLEDAMSWERKLSTRNRYGIRGGMSPAQRAALERESVDLGDKRCGKGHLLAEVGTYASGAKNRLRCKKCYQDWRKENGNKEIAA